MILIATASCFVFNSPGWAIGWTGIVLAVTLVQFLIFLVAMATSRDRSVPAVVTYVFVNLFAIIVMFANLYVWLGLKGIEGPTPTFMEAIYFSVVTWTTLGYGDLTPEPAARLVAATEAIMGYVVMALLIGVVLSALDRK
jgi:hypothetical protein